MPLIAIGLEDAPEPGGDSLQDRLQAYLQAGRRGLPILEVMRYILGVARLLDCRVHPHGNVKPDIMLVRADRIDLVDRPIAGHVPSADPVNVCGTPACMAPEVRSGTRTGRSDQYALASTYVELRTGQLPFVRLGVIDVMQTHLESVPDLTRCSEAKRDVLTRVLAKEPGQRIPTCLRFAECLRDAVVSRPT